MLRPNVTIGTLRTLAFVLDHLPERTCRILEIGAGDGALAGALVERGHAVIALDGSTAAVEAARRRGLDVRLARWPAEVPGPFDVVLFTRSLHHMDGPERAVAAARDVLHDGGRVIVDDFAFADATDATVAWFRERLRMYGAEQIAPEQSFVRRLAGSDDPVGVWRGQAGHIHGAAKLRDALIAAFELSRDETGPYLFRYLEPWLGREWVEAFLMSEERAIARGALVAIGRRWVGHL